MSGSEDYGHTISMPCQLPSLVVIGLEHLYGYWTARGKVRLADKAKSLLAKIVVVRGES